MTSCPNRTPPDALERLAAALPLAVWTMIVAGGHRFMADDVYFYLQIADQIVQGHGSTFTGDVPTNGYHPLWMGVCVLLRLVAGASRHGLVRALFVACALLQLAAMWQVRALVRGLGARTSWPALAVLAYCVTVNFPGSEFHLSLVTLTWFLSRAVNLDHTPKGLALTGVAAGLAMLSRLDNVFAVGLTMAVLVLAHAREAGVGPAVRRALWLGVPSVLVVAPYLAWNLATFGHLMPVSGAVKSISFSPALVKLGKQGAALGLAVPLAIAVAWRSRARAVLVAFAAGAGLHAFYVASFMSSSWPWYFATELLSVAAALALAVELGRDGLTSRVPRVALAGVATAAVLLPMAVSALRRLPLLRAPERDFWYLEAARKVDEVVPRGEGLATTVSPGSIAYFSSRAVYAFDGLTLDFAFHDESARDGLAANLARHKVTHLMSPGPTSPEARDYVALTKAEGQHEQTAFLASADGTRVASLAVISPFHAKPVGTITLDDAGIVARGFCSRDLAIWKVPTP
jgi:hypothetical protein